MEKLQMCRICLAENVNMYVVVNKKLCELYEKLTDVPFVTEDSRPILACFICCAQLKKCYRFQKKCLEAEEMFAKMMNEEYERKPLINQDQFELFHGFIRTPIDTISIVDVDQTESIVVKEELPAVCERLDDIIETEEEHDSDDDIKPFNIYNNYMDIEETPLQHSESDSEDDVPLMKVKTEKLEDKKLSEIKRKVKKTNRSTSAKKPKLNDQKTNQEHKIRTEQENNEISDSSVNKETKKKKNGSKIVHDVEKPYKCNICRRAFSHKGNLTIHVRKHSYKKVEKCLTCNICNGNFKRKRELDNHIRKQHEYSEKPYQCNICPLRFKYDSDLTIHIRIHNGEKPYKCDICQSTYLQKKTLKDHIRIHTGEKPYKCDICDSRFSAARLLRKHILQHTERPFECEICQKSYNCRKDLKIHVCQEK